MLSFVFKVYISGNRFSPPAQTVKNRHAMQDTQVQSLGQDDPLEEEMATQSGVLAWRISWAEEPGRLQSVRGVVKS